MKISDQEFVRLKFGRLTPIRPVIADTTSERTWEFRCDCGNTKTILIRNVVGGITKSCGCLHREAMIKRNTIHGYAVRNKHPIYQAWTHMKDRCNNPKSNGWKYYGGRGIKICERWVVFSNFADDMAPTWKKGLTLGRKDNSRGYNRDNCRWETSLQQSRNRRNVILISNNGTTLTGPEWSEKLGGNPLLVHVRLKRGWDYVRATSTPVKK